jgi:cell division transport system ATP-binding protein
VSDRAQPPSDTCASCVRDAGSALAKRAFGEKRTTVQTWVVKGIEPMLASADVIQLYHVTKRYANGIEALRDVSVQIHEGEFVFLSGPSGAGKSTFIKLLMLLERVSEGQVLVAGRNLDVLRRSSIPYLRRNIGVVWQDFKLLPHRDVFDNVAISLEILGMPRKQIRRRVERVLDMVGLERYARSLPHWLSGGEQQRVAIARALVNTPSILLADEPTGNLDPDLSVDIMQMLLDVQQRGTTVVVATHDRALMDRFGKRVILLNKGFLIEDGAPVDVLPGAPGQVDAEERHVLVGEGAS